MNKVIYVGCENNQEEKVNWEKGVSAFHTYCTTQSGVYFYFPGTMAGRTYSFLLFDVEVTRTLRTLALYIIGRCKHVGVHHIYSSLVLYPSIFGLKPGKLFWESGRDKSFGPICLTAMVVSDSHTVSFTVSFEYQHQCLHNI